MKKLQGTFAVAMLLSATLQSANATEMPQLAKKSGCTACHAIDHKIVGPAWVDVAKRYKDLEAARGVLIERVKKGTKGNWTDVTKGVPMPPYSPRVTDENIEKLVDFILSL
ncbi:MAG: c-type cytochrome [Gammaproteobacteria bacterium]|nr:c-type cytochrome [Gammaproteobacteria bacterium]